MRLKVHPLRFVRDAHASTRALWLAAAVGVLPALAAVAEDASPFSVTATVDRQAEPPEMLFTVVVPPGHYLYADAWSVQSRQDGTLTPLEPPPTTRYFDPLLDAERDVFKQTITLPYPLPPGDRRIEVRLQGCSETICFAPESLAFELAGGTISPVRGVLDDKGGAEASASGWLAGWRIASRASGFMKPEPFLAFLDEHRTAEGAPADAAAEERGGFAGFTRDPAAFVRARGWWLTALMVLLGGLLLNLTPCVLPMIPINLAIIGAGARQGSRGRGFLLGSAYGAGMALAYGLLGLTVVVTGGFFGAIQSSPVFNLVIALIFVVLGLALFDVFAIDFTRFQRAGGGSGRTGVGVALSMGAMSALLAGACVAPVVIAVLLLAGQRFAEGATAALLLPFLLGVGMALPWPFAGAGLAFMPKPGRWMSGVKMVFGAGVLLMALYYGHLAWQGFRPATAAQAGGVLAGDREAWEARLAEARATGKPVALDFWATWCKNCHAMSRTTFRDPAVVEALKGFVWIPVQAEKPGEEPARGHLQALGVSGLPTYLVLVPD